MAIGARGGKKAESMAKGKRGEKPTAVLIKKFTEIEACAPVPIFPNAFNPKAVLPYGLTTECIKQSMKEFLAFLGFINGQLGTKGIHRLESFMMAANFSSLVGEIHERNYPPFLQNDREKPLP